MNTSRISLAVGLVCCLLFLASGYTASEAANRRYESDDECRSCHRDIYRSWQTSKHNTDAYHGERFQAAWQNEHRTGRCLDCHTTGYDAAAGTIATAGVSCSACHTPISNGDFDPDERDHAPMHIPQRVDTCATCHGNDHALTYSEWETSAHNGGIEVGCLACHGAHDTGLIMDDAIELCGSCHFEPVPTNSAHMDIDSGCTNCHPSPVSVDNVHMTGGEDVVADCVACHIVPEYDEWDHYLSSSGHTLEVTLTACISCHGDMHDM